MVLGGAVIEINDSQLMLFLDMQATLAVHRGEQHLHANIIRIQITDIQDHLHIHALAHGQSVGSIWLSERYNLDILPLAADPLLPGGDPAGETVVIAYHLGGALGLRNIILVAVVSQHPVGGEIACHLSDGVLDKANPLG